MIRDDSTREDFNAYFTFLAEMTPIDRMDSNMVIAATNLVIAQRLLENGNEISRIATNV